MSSTVLEERVAMYLQAIEYATAANDNSRRQDLEKDIQTLMDLMEQVSMGQVITTDRVPPPLHLHSHAGEPLANPLGELSVRLADYHKALYYADIEIGQNRTQQIQMLQRGLQVIQKLQEKAQAGYPIRPENIPPPVAIPTDDEFVTDPKSVITERIPLFYQAIEMARQEGKKTRIKTLEAGIQTLHYLLQRAESNIPIYKKDLPCPPALGQKFRQQTEEYRRTVELLTKMSGLSARAAKLAAARGDAEMEAQLRNNAKALTEVLHDYEMGKPLDMSTCPYSLADIERLADQAGVPATRQIQDTETVRLRINQYKLAAIKAKRAGQVDLALQHMRVVKGLQPLIHAAEKGETIDVTQVPPAPSEQTPTTEEAARILTETAEPATEEMTHESGVELDGKSLAEELSAFLEEMPPLENNQGGKRPTVTKFAESPPTQPASVSNQQKRQQGHKVPDVCLQPTPAPLVNKPPPKLPLSSRSNDDGQTFVSRSPLPSQPENSELPSHLPYQKRPEIGHTPKSHGHSNMMIHKTQQSPTKNVVQTPTLLKNGSLCDGSPERLGDQRWHVTNVTAEGRIKGEPPALIQDVSTVSSLTNGSLIQKMGVTSPVLTCIEILKYERMMLDKEGSDDAKLASERLGQQMEEEKQRLRAGGYEAWLAYLGQVEEDVSNINSSMKQARQLRQANMLNLLIIKKELAERELALMRKRLSELQA